MEKIIYSRLVEERLIERFKKEFYQKTGKVLKVEDYQPEGLPFPVIGMMQLETILNQFIPSTFESIMDDTRIKEIAYPRMLFCNLAYTMGYKIRAIATYISSDSSDLVAHSVSQVTEQHPGVSDFFDTSVIHDRFKRRWDKLVKNSL